MCALLFEYFNGKNILVSDTHYNDQNIGGWLGYKKENIKSVNDEWYIKLSKNKYVKKNLDNI